MCEHHQQVRPKGHASTSFDPDFRGRPPVPSTAFGKIVLDSAVHGEDATLRPERTPSDPVVVYDVMREAANRVVGVLAARVTIGGTADPAVAAISEICDEVDEVDPLDVPAQVAATEYFRQRRQELIGE